MRCSSDLQPRAVVRVARPEQPAGPLAQRPPPPRLVGDHFGIVALSEDARLASGHRRVVTLFELLPGDAGRRFEPELAQMAGDDELALRIVGLEPFRDERRPAERRPVADGVLAVAAVGLLRAADQVHGPARRSEEHTSELQSLMSTSYSVSCLIRK